MKSLLGTKLDKNNIGLVKLLYALRQDLDIYCLISVNADKLNSGIGRGFFGHLQQLTIGQIALSLCKIYEEVKGYELNSIDGVIQKLSIEPKAKLDPTKLEQFIKKYKGQPGESSQISALKNMSSKIRADFRSELMEFKGFRDKMVAHAEYGFSLDALPSYDVMEKLFYFGADFYELVSSVFVVISPVPVKEDRKVKTSLKMVFQKIGLTEIKTDME